MLGSIRGGVSRPLVALWLRASPHSWHRHVVAHDSPHVHAPGMNPDRILVTGDGAAAGRGVRTHELGLPGFLARSLSSRTRRATDVEIVVDDAMTVDTCCAALKGKDFEQFDIVLVSLGANEAARQQTLEATQLFRSAAGFAPFDLPRSQSFCDVTVRRDDLLVIEDTAGDDRYADYSVVAGDPGIRFYAGHPIEAPNGQRVGALCVMDTRPRHFSDDEGATLRMLAQRVQTHLFAGPVSDARAGDAPTIGGPAGGGPDGTAT